MEAMASQRPDVYATLLLNDFYLPGALVLAHSLRDAGTSKKLAVLVTTDSVSSDAIAELRKLFDFIIPVERVVNNNAANLDLMGRPDLHSTFTKITLWKQIQFRRIVYMDADTVAIRAPDELFDLPQAFSAAPDIGWPDIFNTGLMVLDPNLGEYYSLLALAERGISFDGADQGLLNMHFKNTYNRLSFTYNVTPSAHYQYLPAYRYFQSTISVAHFIGPGKPWTQGREANKGSTPYDEMVGRWWEIYDRHYRPSADPTYHTTEPLVQYYVKGEFQPVTPVPSTSPPFQSEETQSGLFHPTTEAPFHETTEIVKEAEEIYPGPVEAPFHETTERVKEAEEVYASPVEANAEKEKEPESIYSSWDASKTPPPAGSRPEAQNFPSTQYSMSSDPAPFKAPERYPDPPKDMYYEVPKTPSYQKPTPIFPWEKDAPKPTRVFPEDLFEEEEEDERHDDSGTVSAPIDEEDTTSPDTTTPTVEPASAEPWHNFSRGNAWDEIPEIGRYIGNLQKNRKANIQVLQGHGAGIEQASSPGARIHGLKLTDFPTEFERPSLPVTPAPIRRPRFWGEERDEEGELPAAEGVPSQEDWDPTARLEQLARHQSDVLTSKLGKDTGAARQIPLRSLPYGSEGVISPTYVAQQATISGSGTKSASAEHIEEPSYKGASAAWEKDETFPTQEAPLPPSEEEKDVLDT